MYIEQKIIRTGKLEDLTSEELESRMKTIIDEYSPILEGVDEKELKERVLSKPKSQKDSSSFIFSILDIIDLGKQLRSENTSSSLVRT